MRATVGLTIRANWVEVVEVQQGFRSKAQVTKFGRFPVASPERAQVVEAIRRALEAANIQTKEVVLAIPTQEVILRYFTLPLIPKPEWAGAIQFEARKYVPFKLDELVWDFHASERKAQRQLDVIFVATRKEMFQEYMALLQEAGLKAVAVEAASFGLARALCHGDPALRNTTFTAIDVCGDMAHVALIHQGIPQVARDVFLAGQGDVGPLDQLMRAPAAPTVAPPPEAPTASPAGEQIPVPPVTSEHDQQLASLVSELRLSLDYFAREFPAQDVRQIILCGEDVVGQWRDALAQEVKLPVELARSQDVDRAQTLPLAWTLALGLALHESSAAGARVNFAQYRPHAASPGAGEPRVSASVARPVMAELLVACAGLLALYIVQHAQVSRLQGELRLVRQSRERIELPFTVTDPNELSGLQQRVDERLALLQSTVGSDLYMTPKLSALPRLLPEAVWLESVTISAGADQRLSSVLRGLCVTGDKSRDIETVNKLIEQLRSTPEFFAGFQEAQLASVGSQQQQQTDVTTFEVRATK